MRAVSLLLATAIFCSASVEIRGESIPWVPDLATAQRMAAESNRLVLIHFWSPDCVPCQTLENTVFSRDSVGQMLNDHFVPVKVNAQQEPSLALQYGVDRWPTDVITNPQGLVLKKMVSPQDARQYVARTSAVALQYGNMTGRTADPVAQASYGENAGGGARSGQPGPDTYGQNPRGGFPPRTQAISQQRHRSLNVRAALERPMDQKLAAFRDTVNAKVQEAQQQGYPQADSYQQAGQQAWANTQQYQQNYQPQNSPQQGFQQSASQLQQHPGLGHRQIVKGEPQEIINRYASPGGQAPNPRTQQAPQHQDTQYAPAAAPPYDNQPADERNSNWGVEESHDSAWNGGNDYQPNTSPNHTPAAPPVSPPGDSYQSPSAAGPPTDFRAPAQSTPDSDWSRQINPPAGSQPPAGQPQPSGAKPTTAMDGFCPVTLTNQNSWTQGDTRWGAIHRGRLYLFAGPDQQKEFLSDPDRFSPVLSGIDPVRLTEFNETVDGKREHGVFYRNQIYLFTSEDSLQRFWSAPERYAGPIRQAMQSGTVDQLLRR